MGVRQRSILRRRIARALTALVTVWCLGCDAIDPLLAAARGAGEGMDCAPAITASAGQKSMTSEAATPSDGAALSDGSDGEQRYACGLTSCMVTAPEGETSRDTDGLAGELDVPEPATLASVTRTPLVPPPQRSLDRA